METKLWPGAVRLHEYLRTIAVDGFADVRQTDIAQALGVTQTYVRLCIRRLELNGMLETLRDPQQRRRVYYRVIGG